MNIYWQSWYERNRARLIRKQRARRAENRDKVNAQQREYYKNPKYLKQPSRNPLYRKLRRSGIARNEAAHVAGVMLRTYI